ncbi:YaaA family protein [Brachybacterium sp. AOP43-C2-M15]|uniref:YaaA family protein n=1 Tax=Brachybacterium sp. AOP43-C2-M15 TaxID=3457661 RepID=UPI004033F782
MLILLPPSETKTRPSEVGTGTLDVAAMALPELRSARETVLRAAQRTAAGQDAAARLGVPASSPELVGRMLHLDLEPIAAPLAVYSGVLYDQLDAASAPTQDRRVMVQSALLGLVDAAHDRIPAYRLSAGSHLSRLGKAGSWWAPRLKDPATQLIREQADGRSPVVIDCRSGSYRSMMRLRSTPDVRVLEVAPVQEKDGRRTVVSHDAKRYRGIVTALLLAAPVTAAGPEDVVDQLRAGFAASPGASARGRGLEVELDGDALVIIDRVS